MIRKIYKRHQYFINMLAVLVLLVTTRMFDSFAWTPPSPDRIKIILYEHLFQFFSFLPFIFLFIHTYNLAIRKKLYYMLFLFIVLYTVIGPVLFLLLNTWIETLIWNGKVAPFTLDLVKKYSPGASLVLLFLSATWFITHLIVQTYMQKESAHKAETLAKDVQLKMLRYQINPHFLFNVLNSIYTLVDENTEKAKKLVVDMSEYYRYTLNKHQQTIPIEKEIESIIKYLEIQKTRFEEEFHYDIIVDEAAKAVSIPSFIIHLLIENAIKYGTKTLKQRLIVEISVKLVKSTLHIRVANTGKLGTVNHSADNNGNGTSNGIENIKNRLSLYYNENFSLSLNEENGWVIADITIDNMDAK